MWLKLITYADECSWSAGKKLAALMRADYFADYERVFIALVDDCITGFCTLTKADCIPEVQYTPYIGFVFVGENYRGNRISEKLIQHALNYAGEQGFNKIYLVSDHKNLYEKYGFIKVDEKPAPWNSSIIETIFVHTT